jgi:hypothetical protein
MSIIRQTQEGEWEDVEGLYVYPSVSDRLYGLGMCGIDEFIEVAMRALDQSGKLSREELEVVHAAFEARLKYIDDSKVEERGVEQ